AAEERFRTVADFTYDWEYWMGPDGQFIYVSPACERIMGYRREEFMEDPTLLERIAHPDDRHLVATLLNEWVTSEEDHALDFRVIARDGEERWIGHASQAVYGDDGAFLGQRASNRDTTVEKQAEVERARFTLQLGTAADIAAQVNAILDPDELLNTVIPLLKERFGLYYAHVYVLDEAAGELRLRAGYGEPGRVMLEQGLSIPLDREVSLVA
ncbi:MAG: PAS domain-containing protein, partial [bacterium]|nr:PAS domain-containing protein [bacterium]